MQLQRAGCTPANWAANQLPDNGIAPSVYSVDGKTRSKEGRAPVQATLALFGMLSIGLIASVVAPTRGL